MPDAQAAHEYTLTATLTALAGANLIYGLGMLDSGLTWDYAQAVLHNEMLRMVMKAVEGFPITDEAIAFDVIKEVGHGGEFITHPHTFKNMRKQSQGDLSTEKAVTAGLQMDQRMLWKKPMPGQPTSSTITRYRLCLKTFRPS